MVKQKIKDLRFYLIGIGVVVALNVLSQTQFFRVDMTEDQRYSISSSTVDLIENLDETIYINVYLTGELSSGYTKLQQTITETLNEFKAYGGSNIDFDFVSILDEPQDSLVQADLQDLMMKGVKIRGKEAPKDANFRDRIVIPAATVHFRNKTIAVNFLKEGQNGLEENFDQSINEVEYELALAINTLQSEEKKKIAFIDGHGEASTIQLERAMAELNNHYMCGRLTLETVPQVDDVDALVIVQPQTPFSDLDKYKIDQYVMNGGKVLFFVDAIEVRRDSAGEGILGLPYEHGLDNLLRSYGVRINQDMIQDLQGQRMPITGMNNQRTLMPWNFHPIIETFADHPITEKLNPVLARNLGTIDTIKAPSVRKTPLLFTSKYTRVKGQPVVYDPTEIRHITDSSYFPQKYKPIAYLSEGTFQSLFYQRPLPQGADPSSFKERSSQGKVFTCSDGNIIMNEFSQSTQRSLPLGQNEFTGEVFGNKNFVINVVNYMLNERGIVQLRGKEVIPRDLDPFLIDDKNEQLALQIKNIAIPVVLVILFGVCRYYLRQFRYSKRKKA